MSYEELADVLQFMAEEVRAGDSFEGHIEYLMPDELDEVLGHGVMVSASFRIGNLQGQGGMRMIGDMK